MINSQKKWQVVTTVATPHTKKCRETGALAAGTTDMERILIANTQYEASSSCMFSAQDEQKGQ